MDLETLEDYQKVARIWIENVIPSGVTPIEKVACIAVQSLNVLRDLLWLTSREPLPPDFDSCFMACPVDLWRPVFNEYHPDDLWLYSVLRAVEISSLEHPIFDDVGADLQPSYQDNPAFYAIWPKASGTMTVLCGAG